MTQSSLVLLGEIAVMAGAVAIPAAQYACHDTDKSLYLQIAAAFSDLVALKRLGFGVVPDPESYVRYLGHVLLIIECMEGLNGFGPPDIGDQFSDATPSNNICYTLKNAAPTGWSGKAANHYVSNNDEQQDYPVLLKQADQQIANTLTTQAGQVQMVREGLAGIQIAILGAFGVVYALLAVAQALIKEGLIAQEQLVLDMLEKFVEYSACLAAAAALGLVGWLICCGQENAGAIHRARNKYQEIADGATAMVPGTAAAVGAPTVSVSTASGFSDTAGGPADAAIAFDATSAGSGSRYERVALGAFVDAPGVPTVALPTLDGRKQMSAHASKPSGHTSQYQDHSVPPRRAAKGDVSFADAFTAGKPWNKATSEEVPEGALREPLLTLVQSSSEPHARQR